METASSAFVVPPSASALAVQRSLDVLSSSSGHALCTALDRPVGNVILKAGPRDGDLRRFMALRRSMFFLAEGNFFLCTSQASQSIVCSDGLKIPGTGDRAGTGRTAVIEKPSIGQSTDWDAAWAKELARRKNKDKKYRVLLFNDDFNRREHVVQSLLKVIAGLDLSGAVRIMMKAHSDGMAVAAVVTQEVAEAYCTGLQACGLFSATEPDE